MSLETLLGPDGARFDGDGAPEDPIIAVGSPGRLAVFTDLTQLSSGPALLATYARHPGRHLVIDAFAPPTIASERKLKMRFRPKPDEVRAFYDAGFSIVLHDVEVIVPAILPFVRRLERDLRIPTGAIFVEAFCSRAGSGAAAHFDSTSTFNCQLRGDKTWWLAPNPAVRFPREGLELGVTPSKALSSYCRAPLPERMPDDARVVVARPGTVVFLPSGVLHATRTHDESLALLFTVRSGTIAERVAGDVAARLRRIEALRCSTLAQRRPLRAESRLVAAELRRLAAELERDAARLGHLDHDGSKNRCRLPAC